MDAQADLSLHCVYMSEGTISHTVILYLKCVTTSSNLSIVSLSFIESTSSLREEAPETLKMTNETSPMVNVLKFQKLYAVLLCLNFIFYAFILQNT